MLCIFFLYGSFEWQSKFKSLDEFVHETLFRVQNDPILTQGCNINGLLNEAHLTRCQHVLELAKCSTLCLFSVGSTHSFSTKQKKCDFYQKKKWKMDNTYDSPVP